MDPSVWRKKAGLTLRDMAGRVSADGCGWSSVRRWESGEREAPNFVVLAYEKASNGEVTGADFNRVRKRFLKREENAPNKAA